MKHYDLKLCFTNLDNSLYTPEQAAVAMSIEADDLATAYQLADHLQKVMQADHYILNGQVIKT